MTLSCTQKEILVIKSEPVGNAIKAYAPDCYIKNGNQEIVFNQGFLYKNDILQKYIVPHSESILVYDIKENRNLKSTEPYQTLKLKKTGNREIILFKQKYKILRQNGDTTFLSQHVVIVESSQPMGY